MSEEDLVYSGVTCRFDAAQGRRAALECFSIRAAPGEITCLVGPNGAGKSTALAAAAALLQIQEGSIEYRGGSVRLGIPPGQMGYLPQTSTLPRALTVGEVLDFSFAVRGTNERDRRAIRDLFGLDARLHEPVGTLSSGWTRRLGLAVALIPESRLLLLDEPFVGLDLRVLDSLVDYLDRCAKEGATVVLSSHDFEIIDRLRARIAVLDEGRLLGVLSPTSAGSRAAYRRVIEGEDREEPHARAV